VKTYLRLLSFAQPFPGFLVPYILLVVPAVVFGAVNFTLVIPLLNVLFNTFGDAAINEPPVFHLSIAYVKDLFDYWFLTIVRTEGKQQALLFVCVVIGISVFLANLFRYLAQRVLTRLRVWIVYRLRKSVFEKITSMHLGFFYKRQKGDLMSILSNDTQEIENSVVSTLQVFFREPLVIIVYFIILFMMSVKLTLFTLFFFPVSGLIIGAISKRLKKTADKSQQVLGTILSQAEEAIGGIRIIKGFVVKWFINSKFEKQNSSYRQISKSFINRRELASPVSEFLGVFVVIILIVYGGSLVLTNHSELTASEFITYIVLYSQILPPAKNISNSITTLQRGLAAADRLFQLLDTPTAVQDSTDAAEVTSFNHAIEYCNVDFAYNDKLVLKKINLRIEKGKMIALVGQSGSGKSTLADLLPRFYDLTSGEIRIDGTDIRKIKKSSLRRLMGIVTQEAILFNDTIYNNIVFGLEGVSEDDVHRAARIANAHDFIIQTEAGYQTVVGDRGMRLSGGQRQRISIARAVLRNPPILILDEATSALDTESERLVQEAILNLMKNRTSLVIAHRLSTIQYADEIIVLQQGEIIERGNHPNLIAANGAYRKLHDIQGFS